MRRGLPSGTVTFLFTDIEGSTRLLHELGAERYADALAEHRRALRDAFTAQGGVEVDTQGDAFFYAFTDAPAAVDAAARGQEALAAGPIRVRMGLHTGEPHISQGDYVGRDVHLAARIAAAAHGGQVLLSGATRALVELSAADLGEHRLKDFAEPVWIYQLGSTRFPPLKTISNTNLPRPASSFIGREREVTEVSALLRDGARLVTLSGPGGTGKTRLSIEAAAELVPEFRNGVFWVGLAQVRDPALVTETIAQTLGAKDRLSDHVGERELLLLLDNLEQVIDAAPELGALLPACPNLRLLVTSRELLRVQGEVEYAVPPLAPREAVDLFCERARLEPDETVAELCRRLDSLPLAIELAAARTTVLAPAQILERLSRRLDLLRGGRDTEARQQTLRATIEWSHELLRPEEQRLLARFAIFSGCTLEAAEAVVDADLDVLQALVEKSLVRRTGDRFWMLETIREFAAENLAASGELGEIADRHASYFLALAEEAEPYLRRDSLEWSDRLEQEHDNLRSALDRLAGERALRLAGAVARFWYLKSHLAEGLRWLERALAAGEQSSGARAKALIGASVLALNLRQLSAARSWAEEALSSMREREDVWGTAYSELLLGNVLSEERGGLAAARPRLAASARAFQKLGDELYALVSTVNLAWVTEELGDREAARSLYEEVLERGRGLGNVRLEANALAQLGMMARDDGRLEDAAAMLREALRIDHLRGGALDVAVNLGRLASVLVRAGAPEPAARLLAASEALTAEIGAETAWWAARRNDETRELLRGRLGDAVLAETAGEGRVMTLEAAVALALELTPEAAAR